MLFEATCHTLTPGSANKLYPVYLDTQYRGWINELLHVPGGHPNPAQQLIVSAYECAISILNSAGSFPAGVENFNAYQLDLFLFKDMGIGGILSKFIGRMNDPGFSLPQPVSTWYQSFCDDYMTYLDIAGRDAVLAAQVASPGTQVTIQFIAVALEEAETAAQANDQTLQQYLEA